MKYNWRGVYDVYNGGMHLYTIDELDLNIELDLWRWRGYNPKVNYETFTIQINPKE